MSNWVLYISVLAVLASIACSGAGEAEDQEVGARFLLGGWVAPKDAEPEDDPFSETLKPVIITSDQEMEEWLKSLDIGRIRGNLQALDNVDYRRVVVLGVYYQWRPLKGDPLSLERVALNGNEVRIELQLLDDPQGREFPYLLAPLNVAALERDLLPQGEPLEFIFLVNGEVAATLEGTLE